MSYFRDISTFGGYRRSRSQPWRICASSRMKGCCRTPLRWVRGCWTTCARWEKHAVIGDVRGKGLFCGAELVADRKTREPLDEKKVQAVVAACMARGVIIGATNRSLGA